MPGRSSNPLTEEDPRRKQLLAAAALDDAEACYELYTLDFDVLWLQKAAELGLAEAQAGLGCHFATLSPPDLEQSRFWYLQAALQGLPAAMDEIGFTLLLGEGGPADPVQAVAWLEKSAAAEADRDVSSSRPTATGLSHA